MDAYICVRIAGKKLLCMSKKYHPEEYWTEVADRIASRKDENVIAGDDEPYYRYKRKKFLNLLHQVPFKGKTVLEIGSGPGGNLREVWKHEPSTLMGADISASMIELAGKQIPNGIQLTKVDGETLPFDDDTFDVVFTATVLQHNTDDAMLRQVVSEICRVGGDKVYLFERIDPVLTGDDLCYGRPMSYYTSLMEAGGYKLSSTKFINIKMSYYVCGALRKGLNPKTRKEGEPLTRISHVLQQVTLPITSLLDKVFTSKTDLGRLEFTKVK